MRVIVVPPRSGRAAGGPLIFTPLFIQGRPRKTLAQRRARDPDAVCTDAWLICSVDAAPATAQSSDLTVEGIYVGPSCGPILWSELHPVEHDMPWRALLLSSVPADEATSFLRHAAAALGGVHRPEGAGALALRWVPPPPPPLRGEEVDEDHPAPPPAFFPTHRTSLRELMNGVAFTLRDPTFVDPQSQRFAAFLLAVASVISEPVPPATGAEEEPVDTDGGEDCEDEIWDSASADRWKVWVRTNLHRLPVQGQAPLRVLAEATRALARRVLLCRRSGRRARDGSF